MGRSITDFKIEGMFVIEKHVTDKAYLIEKSMR
ncbi:MAG: hypothetical protein ACJAX4_000893 [Clostridium sp.]|jgi:hypothetical protein